jgi:peptide/nickel transport system permease protein
MSLITFTISRVIPADPAAAAAGLYGSAEQIETIRKNMGLDKPLWQQYLTYMENLVLRGDLGRSISSNSSVRDDLFRYLPASLELALFAVLLFLPTGIVLGVLSARKAGGWVDATTRGFAILGMSLPIFWLGIMMQIVFFGWLDILPATGRISSYLGPPPHVTGFYTVDSLLAGNLPMFGDAVWHMILPGLALALGSLAVVTRMTRSSVLEVLGHDYVRTARSKGLRDNMILFRHVLRNSMIPIVTIVALQMAGLIAWQFLVETIFSWPGIGSWAVQSILTLDFQVIMAVTLFGAILYVGLNFVADVIYIWLDPRIRI